MFTITDTVITLTIPVLYGGGVSVAQLTAVLLLWVGFVVIFSLVYLAKRLPFI